MAGEEQLRLGDYLEDWLARRASQLRPATVANYRQTLRCYLTPELLGLRWTDVDLVDAQVRIRRCLSVVDGVARLLGPKTSRGRRLSIGASVVAALEREHGDQKRRRGAATRWAKRWGLVFTDEIGSPLEPMMVTREFRRLVREVDVPVIRLHDVRHTYASLLLAEGVPIKVISERLGHTTIAMTMDTYAHLLPAMDEDAAARFDDALDRATR